MEFNENDKKWLVLNHIIGVVIGLIFCIVIVIALTVFSIVSFAKGDEITGSVVLVPDAVGVFGIAFLSYYIYIQKEVLSQKSKLIKISF